MYSNLNFVLFISACIPPREMGQAAVYDKFATGALLVAPKQGNIFFFNLKVNHHQLVILKVMAPNLQLLKTLPYVCKGPLNPFSFNLIIPLFLPLIWSPCCFSFMLAVGRKPH